ncbi:MAG: zinc ABC transporter substrate-binding protein [Kiritimatiellae bacterium]|nr:zinc ABC transporter substrate-binding protein [Kiritimatiellia bacterium]
MRQNAISIRAALAAALVGGACAASAADAPAAPSPEKIRVVATIFPAWDWVREVVGAENAGVELTMLLDDGVDLHSYQPTAEDLKKVAESDLFVHVGGESDGWVAPALAAAPNPRRKVLNLVEALGHAVKAEEIVEGMEHEHHDELAHHDDEEEEELDEHVWLSLRHAQTLAGALADSLAALDPSRAAAWRANAAAYCAKLAALDKDYAAAVAAAPRKTLVVADRFPLRYLADDYGLAYFAAFSGCSAETEASFKTVVFLAGKADELGAKALLVLEGANHRIAETVRAAGKAKDRAIVEFDSLQSTTASETAAGKTYFGTMHKNLDALSGALK